MATISWQQGTTGLWTDPTNWVGGVVPGADDTAVFAAGTFNAATIDLGTTVAIADVTLAGNTTPSAFNSINILGTLDLAGVLSLGAGSSIGSFNSATEKAGHGVISGGTIDLTGGSALGTVGLNAVTVIGTPTTTFTIQPGTITNGLTSQVAVLDLSAPTFVGDQMLLGNTLDIGAATLSGTLTVGAGTEIDNSTFAEATGGGALINDGIIVEAAGASFDPFQVDLTNAGVITLLGSSTELGGTDFANTGVVNVGGSGLFLIEVPSGATADNAGLLHVEAGSTLSISGTSLDDVGGTIVLDAGATFAVSSVMTGGSLVGAGGTVAPLPSDGTLDSVSLLGDLTLIASTFSGTAGFKEQAPGVRATADVEELTLIGFGSLDSVNLTLAMQSTSQPGVIVGTGALILGSDSDLVVQNTSGNAATVTAEISLSLAGTIEAAAGTVTLLGIGGLTNTGLINVGPGEVLSLDTNGAAIDNAGTIAVAADGTVSIGSQVFGTAPSFSNAGVLQLAAGSTLVLGVDLSAASFADNLQSGATLIFDGTLTGSTVAGNGSITLPTGVMTTFGNRAALVNVTVLDETPSTVAGTLSNVVWQGMPLVVSDNAVTVVKNGLSVVSAAGGPGSIVVAGTNASLNFQTDTTLESVDIAVGSSVDSDVATLNILDGSNSSTSIDSNLTLGVGSTISFVSGGLSSGLNNFGTFAIGGVLQIGLTDNDPANTATNQASDAAGATYLDNQSGSAPAPLLDAVGANQIVALKTISPNAKINKNTVVVKQHKTLSLTPYELNEIARNLFELEETTRRSTSPGSGSTNAIRPALDPAAQALGSSETPSPEFATSNESTLDGAITMTVGDSAIAFLNARIGPDVDLSFASSTGIYALTDPAHVAGAFMNFSAGDAIDLSFVQSDGGTITYANGQLFVPTAAGTYALNVAFGAGYSAADVQLADDGYGGTAVYIQAPCYVAGTRIATPDGERPVEALATGDLVRTASGAVRPVRWVGHRSYAGRFITGRPDILPILFRAGALADNVPTRNLFVSPKHAMFLDGVLVPAERLVNGTSIVQSASVSELTYFHIELDSHDILLAEGAPSESFVDCDSRGMFQNAHEFGALYPDDRSRTWAFCAPRVEDGLVLAAIRARLATRAGLAGEHAEDAATPGPLHGIVDVFDHRLVTGWAFDPTRSHSAVRLAIVVDGVELGTVVANQCREDVHVAGRGSRHCGFSWRFPAELSARAPHVLTLRRADGAELRRALHADPVEPGPLEGHVDTCTPTLIEGWALDTEQPRVPVRVEVTNGARVIGCGLADQYRADLAEAGKGNGYCRFVVRLEAGAAPQDLAAIVVRRASDGMRVVGASKLKAA